MTVTFGFVDPAHQAWMLLDHGRVDAYARAIREVVRAGDVVLDIGSGSGVLALLAARAGARHVFAVERTGMVELVRAHARENGLEHVVTPIREDLLDVTLDTLGGERPRVILGEVLGPLALDEGQHQLYAHARTLAQDDAVTLPRAYRLVFAAAAPKKLDDELARLKDVHGVSLGALVARLSHRVSHFALERGDLAGPLTASATLDAAAPLPSRVAARVVVERDGPVTGVMVAFEAELSASVTLSTSPLAPPTHWGQVFFPLSPALVARAGDVLDVEIRPRVATDRGTWAWTVRAGDVVRKGDAMKSLVGELADTAAQLGLSVKDDDERFAVSRTLLAWAAALGAQVEDPLDVHAMAARVNAAPLSGYPDESAALQEVRALLRAAGATRGPA